MEERSKKTKIERVIEVTVCIWFKNVKSIPGNRLSGRNLKRKTVGRVRK